MRWGGQEWYIGHGTKEIQMYWSGGFCNFMLNFYLKLQKLSKRWLWCFFLPFQAKCESESVSRSVVSDSGAPWTVACQAPLSMEFFRQECWSGLPVPSPGALLDPGIESRSPELQADSLLFELGEARRVEAKFHGLFKKDMDQIWKRHVHPSVHRSTVYNRQDMEAT